MVTASAAEDGFLVPFFLRPNCRLVVCDCRVAVKARKPLSAAFKFDRDNIYFAVVMSTAGFGIHVDALYVDRRIHHLGYVFPLILYSIV